MYLLGKNRPVLARKEMIKLFLLKTSKACVVGNILMAYRLPLVFNKRNISGNDLTAGTNTDLKVE